MNYNTLILRLRNLHFKFVVIKIFTLSPSFYVIFENKAKPKVKGKSGYENRSFSFYKLVEL